MWKISKIMKSLILFKAILALGLSCFLICGKVIAQDASAKEIELKNSIGLRLGETSGVTFDHKFNKRTGIKIIAGAFPYTYGLTILSERYCPARTKGFSFYYGVGGHIAGAYHDTWYYTNVEANSYTYQRTYGYTTIVGIDMIGGIEYKFPNSPLILCCDVKPNIEFFNGYGPYFRHDPSIGAKFAF